MNSVTGAGTDDGSVAERLKAPASKAGGPARAPQVRILPLPRCLIRTKKASADECLRSGLRSAKDVRSS